MDNIVRSLNDKEKQEVVALSSALVLAQAKEDSKEALATIPTLGLNDIPLQGKENPLAVKQSGGITVLRHEIDTTGILYVKILFPLDHVRQEDLPLLSLYCRALTEMGTKNYDFVDLGLEISARTGGLDTGVSVHSRVDEDEPFMHLRISAKVVEEKSILFMRCWKRFCFKPIFPIRNGSCKWSGRTRRVLSSPLFLPGTAFWRPISMACFQSSGI